MTMPQDPLIISVDATVKWFNPVKGFGFVKIDGIKEDAFLHISVLTKAGLTFLHPETKIVCNAEKGDRGIMISEIIKVKSDASSPKSEEITGTVKFYSTNRKFGFVSPINGGSDIYIGYLTLKLAGIKYVTPGQKVKVRIFHGSKGATAEHIVLC